jgi:Rrf2 family iron-sulfur cluster assembly transcriptional regulator
LCALYLAKHHGEGATGAVEIAESQGLDLNYTQQILQRLRKGGLVESERGPKGGYRLSRAPQLVTLRDILYATEGDTFQIICDHSPIHPSSSGSTQCSTKETCGLHTVWQELRGAIDKLLEERSLADLLRAQPVHEPLVQLAPRYKTTAPLAPPESDPES